MEKSIVFPAFFPQSNYSIQEFRRALHSISHYDISTIEFCYQGREKSQLKETLQDSDLHSIYLGAKVAKNDKLNLSSLDNKLRERSVEAMKECIEEACGYGSHSLLLNSGPRPENPSDERGLEEAKGALQASLTEILSFARTVAPSDFSVTLEPGDTDVDAFEVVGPTEMAIELCQDLRREYPRFGLTLDTSHLRQLGENPIPSIKRAVQYCNHIHLANCVINHRESDLYGDKHPEFGVAGGEFDEVRIEEIYQQISALYKNTAITIGLEIICREGDGIQSFQSFPPQMKWFFGDSFKKNFQGGDEH